MSVPNFSSTYPFWARVAIEKKNKTKIDSDLYMLFGIHKKFVANVMAKSWTTKYKNDAKAVPNPLKP